MRKGYGQFCPVAKAAEVLAERWTPLVMRELLEGSKHFNDLHRGVPLMSRSLLSLRLKQLEAVGAVERRSGQRGWEYHLTSAGNEISPIIQSLGEWGQRWYRSNFGPEDLDVGRLMWALRTYSQARALSATTHHRPIRLYRRAREQAPLVGGQRSVGHRHMSVGIARIQNPICTWRPTCRP